MQKIIPHIWYDKEAREAAEFYVAAFPNSRVKQVVTLPPPSDEVYIVSFELSGMEFQAISAGPMFQINPSVSFLVECESAAKVDRIYEKLSPGGQELVPLGAYPFSERFVWLQDRYGLSWQISYWGAEQAGRGITPVVMFVGEVCGKAEEAVKFWTSLFPGSRMNTLMHYGPGEEPDREGTLKFGDFSLFDQPFRAMDSAQQHQFAFNEAISFIVNCETQAEIDEYWAKLSADPEAEACGWLKDRFGFSWQIVPAMLDTLMTSDDRARVERMSEALLKMKKLDIAELQAAFDGR